MPLSVPEFALAITKILQEEADAFAREAVEVSQETMARIIVRLNDETAARVHALIIDNFPDGTDFLKDTHLLDGEVTLISPPQV